ncbi:hypothetical protein [Erwinia aphidicola]|uniref:hypothetical protein n=1 Tax=Erwinia aphidicola TaxID=68334 RepID=UPI003CE8B7F9
MQLEEGWVLLNKASFSLLGVLNLLFGLYVQFYLATVFGYKNLELFFLGVTLCGVVITMATGGINSYLVSNFSTSQKGSLDIKNTTLSFIALFGVIGVFVFIALSVIGIYLINLDVVITLNLAIMFFFYFVSLAINLVFQSYSYCKSNCASPLSYELYCALSYIACILLMFLYKHDFYFVCALFCFRGYIQQFLYFMFIYKDYNRESFSLMAVVSLLNKIKLIISGSAYYKSEPVVDRLLLVNGSSGIAAYHLVSQIYTAALGLWYKVSVSVLLKKLTESRDDSDSFNKIYSHGLLQQFFLCLFSGIVIFFTPILHWLSYFSILEFLSKNVSIVHGLYVFFCASLLGQVISNTFYTIGKHNVPVLVSCITFTIFLPLKYYIIGRYGVYGLCLLVSIYHLSNALILFFILRRYKK